MENKREVINNYTILKTCKLGEGGFATVYVGVNSKKEKVAIKKIPKEIYKEHHIMISREVDIMKNLKSNYIVGFIDEFFDKDENKYLAIEYCDGGSLEDKVLAAQNEEDREENAPIISESEGRLWLKEIAVAFLKTKIQTESIVMHRDIKPDNILLKDDHIKITDFGWAKMITTAAESMKMNTTMAGTVLYMSPQILNGKTDYTYKCDVWSAGFMMYELMIGRMPWEANSKESLQKQIEANKNVEFPKGAIDEETEQLLRGMLAYEEKDRFTWEQVYSHPALENEELEVEDLTSEEKAKLKIKE